MKWERRLDMDYYTTETRDWQEALTLSRLIPAAELGLALDFRLISDTHLRHRNIAGYTGRPSNSEERIVERWRSLLGPRDQIVHLGDLALGQSAQVRDLLAGLPGEKFLLRGNHDRQSSAYYQSLGFTLIPPFRLDFAGWIVSFTHAPHPELIQEAKQLNCHGHIHEKLERSSRLINCSVEWTAYAPVRVQHLLAERITHLASNPPEERAIPLSYAEWLAREFGGEILRSDTERFLDEDERDRVRLAYARYRIDLADRTGDI
jgi:calcineurin-like phosphoesterase family protein